MAHLHKCRYCADDFVCAYPADDCFANWITCDDCFRLYEKKWLWFGLGLVIVAAMMTWFVVKNFLQ